MATRLLPAQLAGPRLVAPRLAGASSGAVIPVPDLRLLYSDRNLLEAVAGHLAAQLVGDGYLVYYLTADALQTSALWYPNYTPQFDTYAQDPAFAEALTTAKGIVTLHDGETAFPRWLARPTNEGAVGSEQQVQVPVFGLSIDPDVPLRQYELGSRLWWRARAVHLDGRVRDSGELRALADRLGVWLDEEVEFDVADVDGESGFGSGTVQVKRRSIDTTIDPTASDPDRFHLELHAHLEYVA